MSCRAPAVKPVGKPDAGNRHVRFDERGEETERWFPVGTPSHRASPRLYQIAVDASRNGRSTPKADQAAMAILTQG
jgi:hypothetical protein